MDELDNKKLAKIVEKEPVALTEDEKQFIRSRVSYLNPQQKATYTEVIKGKNVAPKPVVDNSPTLTTLKKKARQYGYNDAGVSKNDLDVAVRTAEGADYAPKPE
jgi:hypothetical protein